MKSFCEGPLPYLTIPTGVVFVIAAATATPSPVGGASAASGLLAGVCAPLLESDNGVLERPLAEQRQEASVG